MHEMQVTKRILEVVLEHASRHGVSEVVTIHLRIGALSDLEDAWLQRYFDYLSKGTPAADARLAIRRTPIVLACEACGKQYEVARDDFATAACPACAGTGGQLVSGRGYFIENMEAR